jgi:hypothetical protein
MVAINTRPKPAARGTASKTDGLCHEAILGVKRAPGIVPGSQISFGEYLRPRERRFAIFGCLLLHAA